jgi:hypothetical protein
MIEERNFTFIWEDLYEKNFFTMFLDDDLEVGHFDTE